MLKRTGWLIVFLILLGLFGLAATIDVGSALPIAQGDNGAALEALPGNLVLLAKTKCPYDFCYGCEKEKVCVVWKLTRAPTIPPRVSRAANFGFGRRSARARRAIVRTAGASARAEIRPATTGTAARSPADLALLTGGK